MTNMERKAKKSTEKTSLQNKVKQSLTKKLNATIIGILGIIFIALTAYNSIKHYNDEITTSTKLVTRDNEFFAEKLRAFLDSSLLSAESLKEIVEEELKLNKKNRSREVIYRALMGTFKSNPGIGGLGVYFEPNSFDGKDDKFRGQDRHSTSKGRFCPYVYYNDKGKLEPGASEDIEDSTSNDFYTAAIKSGKVHLTQPDYVDIDGNKIFMTTYNIPIKDKKQRIIGLVQCDIYLDKVIKSIQKYRKYLQSSYYVLTSGKGKIVAHSRYQEKIMKNEFKQHPGFKSLYKNLMEEKILESDEISPVTGEETKNFFSSIPIRGTEQQWVLKTSTLSADFIAKAKGNVFRTILAYIGILLIIGLAIKVLVNKMISHPFFFIQRAMTKLSQYNLNTDAERQAVEKYITSQDEVGDITRSIDLMIKNLREIVNNIASHSKNTADTAKELTNIAHTAGQSAKEVTGAVGNIAEGANSQAHETQEAAQNMEISAELLSNMINILKELSNAIEHINFRKEEGHKALSELYAITNDNREQSIFIKDIIVETHRSAESISKASEMIQSIADQTNLLALNAAIESARAGEAGKGFAVVSDEIRKLAEDSTTFTEEIVKIISELKDRTESGVQVMEAVGDKMNEQRTKAEITMEKFENISNAVDKSTKILEQVNLSSENIRKKNSYINEVIQNLSAIAEENASTSEEVAANVDSQMEIISNLSHESDSLAIIAEQLDHEISKFNLQ